MNLTKESLVSVSIESTLLKTGGIPLLDKVNYGLAKKFNSSIVECYEHPEYLKEIFQEILGEDWHDIPKSIVKDLTAFNYDDKVMKFIETVSY
jgi:hypothetical protein